MSTLYIFDPVAAEVLDEAHEKYNVYLGFGDAPTPWVTVANEVDAIIVRTTVITDDMITMAPRLKVIARHGVGYDTVDIDAATHAGIWVTTTPGRNTNAVAEHVFALILGIARKMRSASNFIDSGMWDAAKPKLIGTELRGSSLGIVGFGKIGQRVAEIARGFQMEILIADPAVDSLATELNDAKLVALDELLRLSDVVTIHAPLTEGTHHLLDEGRLSVMKTGAVLINTSRGGLVDESALERALRDGRIRAGLDVLETEQGKDADALLNPLLSLGSPSLLVTPHIAGQTHRSLSEVGFAAMRCVQRALNGDRPENAVNEVAAVQKPSSVEDSGSRFVARSRTSN